LKLAAGIALDRLLGEPRRWHPLVGFGRWAQRVERVVRSRLGEGRMAGVLAWVLAVLPWCSLAVVLACMHPLLGWGLDIALLYLALGGRSLEEHGDAVATPLAAGDLETARTR